MAFLKFVTEILNSDPSVPTVITINSSGGSVMNAISIYNILKSLPNPVYTLITSQCSSAANLICFATPFERRFAFRNTVFFAHSVHCNSSIEDCKTLELKGLVKIGEKHNTMLRTIFSEETTISTEKLYEIYNKDDEIDISPEELKVITLQR